MRPANIFLKHGLVVLTLAIGSALPALAQDTQIEFGDNASEWAEDGECDDARFTGEGMAFQPTQAEIMHDATDCEAAFNAGTVTLRPASEIAADAAEAATTPAPEETSPAEAAADEPATTEATADAPDATAAETSAPDSAEASADDIDFGDNDSSWSKNGLCDDPRFEGSGMASVLNDADILHDAADCRIAFRDGLITLKTPGGPTDIYFGDDSTPWPNDGECDDPRFTGEGMARNVYPENAAKDASDCRAAFDLGTVTYQGEQAPEPFDYGSDSSVWANDGECDDLRFTGPGTDKKLLSEDVMGDATDCRTLEEAGSVTIRTVYTPEYIAGAPYDSSAIEFGDNSSSYANDDECDDPRFEGPGAAYSPSESHLNADADDCRAAYEAGRIRMIDQGL